MTQPDSNQPGEGAGAPAAELLDETLVAYLDGQLAATESESVEARLAADKHVRKRLQDFDRVWNALDALPRSNASEAFTRTTIDMAAVSAPDDKKATGRLRLRTPAFALIGLLGLVLGSAMAFWLYSAPERRLLIDLPVAVAAPALEQAGSIDFLRLLAEDPSLLEGFTTTEHEAEAADWAMLTSTVLPERRKWVAEQDASTLVDLNDLSADFQARPEEKRQQLRDLAAEVQAADDATELRTTALAYTAMVSRLPQAYQSKLRQMPEDDRLREVRRRARGWRSNAALELNGEEKVALRAAIDQVVQSDSYRDVMQAIVKRAEHSGLPGGRNSSRWIREKPEAVLRVITGALARPDRINDIPEMFRDQFQRRISDFTRGIEEEIGEAIPNRWGRWTDQLAAALPERARAEFERRESVASRARALMHLIDSSRASDQLGAFVSLDEREMETALLESEAVFRERLMEESMDEIGFGGPRGGPGFGGSRGRRGRGGPPRDDRPRGPQDGPPRGGLGFGPDRAPPPARGGAG